MIGRAIIIVCSTNLLSNVDLSNLISVQFFAKANSFLYFLNFAVYSFSLPRIYGFVKNAINRCTVITHQISGSHKMTALYPIFGTKIQAKRHFPASSIKLETKGVNLAPSPCSASLV